MCVYHLSKWWPPFFHALANIVLCKFMHIKVYIIANL